MHLLLGHLWIKRILHFIWKHPKPFGLHGSRSSWAQMCLNSLYTANCQNLVLSVLNLHLISLTKSKQGNFLQNWLSLDSGTAQHNIDLLGKFILGLFHLFLLWAKERPLGWTLHNSKNYGCDLEVNHGFGVTCLVEKCLGCHFNGNYRKHGISVPGQKHYFVSLWRALNSQVHCSTAWLASGVYFQREILLSGFNRTDIFFSSHPSLHAWLLSSCFV